MSISLKVESVAVDAVNLKWLDSVNPSNTHAVKRSSDGISYSTIATAGAGDTTYEDSGLDTGTKYWYKIVDGATESNVETVWTQVCYQPPGRQLGAALPQAGTGSDPVSGDTFDQAMAQLEGLVQSQGLYSANNCDVCVDDGRVILDCSRGCKVFRVQADTDINSISILGCGDVDSGTIQFVIPENTTIGVCGFPIGFGFEGHECFDAPVSGGPNGRIISVDYSGSSASGARGAGNGEGARAKPPSGTGGQGTTGAGRGGAGRGGPLTITCLTSVGGANSSCSADCSSSKTIRFQVSGGVQPYTPTTNVPGGSITNLGSGLYEIVAPANAGSGVAGTAYVKYGGTCVNSGGVPTACPGAGFSAYSSSYNCNDVLTVACGSVFSGPNVGNCSNAPLNLGTGSCSSVTPCHDGGVCTNGSCDARTAGMIAANCNPCGVTMGGKTFTITDAVATSINKTIKV